MIVVDRPGAVQTEIRVGNVAIPRKHPDYTALDLAVKVLGGEGANRIQRVLRSERGLTYGASADIQALKQAGGIVAETDTRSETTGEALRLVVDEFFRLQREPVYETELGDAQAYLTGNFPLTIETPDAIALQVLNALFYDLDVKDLETYRERVNAIKSDDIQRVARAYLKPAACRSCSWATPRPSRRNSRASASASSSACRSTGSTSPRRTSSVRRRRVAARPEPPIPTREPAREAHDPPGLLPADRVEPACRHATSCGGCPWQHVAYPAQLRLKRSRVEEALRASLGRLDVPVDDAIGADVVPGAPRAMPWGFRRKVHFVFAQRGPTIVMGHYRRGLA